MALVILATADPQYVVLHGEAHGVMAAVMIVQLHVCV